MASQAKNGIPETMHATEKKIARTETAIKERVEHARDLVEDLRDRAEIAFHERPYLLPLATGALGLGIGVLIGSKLSRILLFTATGALLSETFRDQIARLSRELIHDLGERLGASEAEDIEGVDSGEPSPTS